MRAALATISVTSLFAGLALGGCVERRVWIDTDPPGALVWLNEAQLGRSPVDVGISQDGVYSLRLEKDGFEPVITGIDVRGPLWDQPPVDFFAEVLPIDARADSRWTFVLRPRDDSEDRLLERASEMRSKLGAQDR